MKVMNTLQIYLCVADFRFIFLFCAIQCTSLVLLLVDGSGTLGLLKPSVLYSVPRTHPQYCQYGLVDPNSNTPEQYHAHSVNDRQLSYIYWMVIKTD